LSLPGDKAPDLATNKAVHLEADAYHEAMKDPNAVIIDVRNQYESAIGHFQPPEGGAELIDPLIRNSHEFPRWLNAPETQARLQGKKVHRPPAVHCLAAVVEAGGSAQPRERRRESLRERERASEREGGEWHLICYSVRGVSNPRNAPTRSARVSH